jgi:hypothetical protein
MYCKKPSPLLILLLNTIIVAAVFMIIDYLYYGLIAPGPDPYGSDLLEKFIYTVLFSLFFAHLYNRSSRIWRPNSDEAFLFKNKVVADTDLCKPSFAKISNGMVFSLLVCAVIIMAMELATLVISTVYLYVLHGARGIPADSTDSAVFVGKVLISGVALEYTGKTEGDPDRG